MLKFFSLLFSVLFGSYAAFSQDNSISLKKSEKKKSLSPYAFGYNAQLMRGPGFDVKEFLDAVVKLNPQNLRYPGGTNANYWDWKTGWIKEGTERKEWKNLPVNKNTLADFSKAILEKDTPVFVLNMLTSTLQEQLAMLREAVKTGLPVKLIELGNEFYLSYPDYKEKFPGAHEYAAICNLWIDSIKKEFPYARVAVVGNSLRDVQVQGKEIDSRARDWNKIVYAEIKNADAITFHHYTGTGLDAIKTTREKMKHKEKADYTKEEQEVWQEAFDKKEGLERFLCMPFVRVEMFRRNDLSDIPAGKNVWITEFNLFENEGIVSGTWAHGLYAITEALLLLNIQQTELICYHNLSHSSQFGAVFHDDNAFEKNYTHSHNKTYGISASGFTLSILGKLLNCNKLSRIEINNCPQILFGGTQKYPAIIGFDTMCGQLLINLSDKEIKINDGGTPVFKMAQIKYYTADPRKQIGFENEVKTTIQKSSRITKLPPYSISVLTQ